MVEAAGSMTYYVHGEGGKTPEYRCWGSMKSRCENKRHPDYENYGGRGIRVCRKWAESYAEFLKDMGRRPTSRHTLNRINNDGPYSPENCEWATYKAQNNNRRINTLVSALGKTLTIAQWSDATGLPQNAIGLRLKHGWSAESAVTRPLQVRAERVAR